VLSKSRCPHTGVVNFFTKADPLLAVGSVAETGAPARYVWRCYVGEEACGLTADISLAEALLRRAIAGGDTREVGNRRRKGEIAARQSHSAAAHWRKLNEAALDRSRRLV
jgi:hypothetical protein